MNCETPAAGPGLRLSNALLLLVVAALAALAGLLLAALAGLLALLARLVLLAALLTAALTRLLVLLAARVRILRAHEVSLMLRPSRPTGPASQRSGSAALLRCLFFKCLLT
jgi:hypothetical protein